MDFDNESEIAEQMSESLMAEDEPELMSDDPVALKIKRSD